MPVVALCCLAACLAGDMLTENLWLQLAMLALSALMMVELNNENSLIRVYSRMVSCSFLVMTVMSSFLLQSITTGIV